MCSELKYALSYYVLAKRMCFGNIPGSVVAVRVSRLPIVG